MSAGEWIGLAFVGLLILGFGNWVASMFWPFTSCGKCDGSGRRSSPSGRNYGRCRRCKGAGERLRFGRRVINRLGVAKDKLIG